MPTLYLIVHFLFDFLEGDNNETDEDVDHEEGDNDEIDEVVEEYHGPEWMNAWLCRQIMNECMNGWMEDEWMI